MSDQPTTSSDQTGDGGSADSSPDGPGGPTDTGLAKTGASGISSLTGNVSALKDNGKPDLKLSRAVADEYIKRVTDFRATLSQIDIDSMKYSSIGAVGNFQSAVETRRNLIADIDGPDGFRHKVLEAMDWSDAFVDLINKSTDRALNEG